jgi:hypothetical protein
MLAMFVLFAQSLIEYTGTGASSGLTASIGSALSSLRDGLAAVDQRTWLMIGGGLLVLAFLTRRSRTR